MNYKKVAELLGSEQPKSGLQKVSLHAESVGYSACLLDFLNLVNEGLSLDIIHPRLLAKYDALVKAFNEK